MIVTHVIHIDLVRPGIEPRINAVQDDKYSRNLKILLFAAGVPWVIPEGTSVLVRYRKPDGTGGIYDTLPDGSVAPSMTENALTVALAPQVLTVTGPVSLTVTMIKGKQQLTTFSIFVQVNPNASANLEDSEDYFNVTGFLPAPISAAVGQYLVVEEVDANGKITKIKAVEAPTGGSDSSQNVTVRPATLKDGEYNVLAINHRGYSATAPENTIPAYILSKEKGFNYVEADISFTSDGVAVLLHDSTIDRTSNGSGSISGMTYAQASQYDYGSWKNEKYTGTRIPTFEEFIILCKRIGLHPYIELKQNGAYTQEQIQTLVAMVKNCGMAGKVTWISFASSYLEYVKAADPSARLGFLVSSVTAAVITTAQGLQTDTNEVFIDSSDYDADAVSRCQEAGLPLEIWTINNSTTIQNMDAYITGVTSDSLIAGKILHDAGMVYDYGITAVSLTGISAEYTGGNVPVGTPLSELMGISVTGYYSDGSAGAVTGYTLSGTITEGNNVITVSYDGFTATFTVTGVAGSGGEIEKTLTSISATYSGGDVAVGTDVTALSGVTVTAYYDDGTSETVTGYTLSGTITEGNNVITVSYEGVTTTISVTGVVTELLHSWNLRESVTDTVAGVTMVGYGAAQTANGLEITENDAVADFGEIYGLNRTYEIDVVSCSAHQYETTSHGRLFAVDNDTNTASGGSAFLHTHNKANRKGWHFYSDSTGGWNSDISAELCGTKENGYAKGVFDGKTVKFYVGTDSHVTLYVDGVEKGKTVYPFKEYPNGHVYIGSGVDDSLAQTVVSGLRVYSGKHV